MKLEYRDRFALRTPATHRAPPSRWRILTFLSVGFGAACLMSYTAVLFVSGLSTSVKPTPEGNFYIPPYTALVECNAHVSHEILRIKNGLPALSGPSELKRLHRDYRRLHRLLRQVGRRDHIPAMKQTADLRTKANALNNAARPVALNQIRHARCRTMAELPIARRRSSQRIVGR